MAEAGLQQPVVRVRRRGARQRLDQKQCVRGDFGERRHVLAKVRAADRAAIDHDVAIGGG